MGGHDLVPQAKLLEARLLLPSAKAEGSRKSGTERIDNVARKSNKIFPVVTALWFHLFPFRTEKLSTVAPMVLHTRGRVGRRHFPEALGSHRTRGFFCPPASAFPLRNPPHIPAEPPQGVADIPKAHGEHFRNITVIQRSNRGQNHQTTPLKHNKSILSPIPSPRT